MTWITVLWFIFVPVATLLFGYGKGYLDGARQCKAQHNPQKVVASSR